MERYTRAAYAVNQMVGRESETVAPGMPETRLCSLCLVLASLWALSSAVWQSVAPKFPTLWFPAAETASLPVLN